MTAYTEESAREACTRMGLAGWDVAENTLSQTFEFQDFVQAWGFMSKVAILAEKHNHHPEWRNVYHRVHIALRTHDAGDVITDRDLRLAQAIDTCR